ncbi:mitofusin [Borealophlyctis nickersoniae]|nr:mitofusin [Borealophlyctis nickersoniae]
MSQTTVNGQHKPSTPEDSVVGSGKALRASTGSPAVQEPSLVTKTVDMDREAQRAEQNQALFAQRRDHLLGLINHTRAILDDLSGKGRHSLVPHYPVTTLKKSVERASLRRPEDGHITIPAGSAEAELQVLQLDLKSYKEPTHASSSSLATSSTEPANDNRLFDQLLATKLQECGQHLEKLRTRISDTRSKVLVTGDLNAGKSTFVNAVLRREVVPDDQQPCTALFAEVVDVEQNDGVEEVHGISHPEGYDRTDPRTFTRLDFRHLREIIEENEDNFELLKIYCTDRREKSHSLLHNGVVDITLIDSPGLNIDSMKTTALFATQEEIDVVIFVVNAENHFTLSGREFLTTAGKEKAYVFIVVNRFDQIRRKDRCRKDILEQIRQISPRTYEEADNLVHFVSAKQCLHQENTDMMPDFIRLEECLRSFILEKRARSKLAPAKVYLHNLLSDVVSVARFNSELGKETARRISKDMQDATPAYDRMLKIKEQVLDHIDKTIDGTGDDVQHRTEDELIHFIDNLEAYADDVEWSGAFYVLQYARDLRNTIYRSAAMHLNRCEDYARDRAVACVRNIENMAATCMDVPPSIDLGVVASAFEGDAGTTQSRSAPGKGVTKIVPMELTEFFDQADKAEIAKEYVPSLALMSAGLVGYRRMVSQGWRATNSMGMSNAGKLAFAGLTIAGIGIFFYVLADMKNNVERKILSKMRAHLAEVGFVESNVDRIAKNTRRVLRLAIWDFQNQFAKILGENKAKRENQQQEITKAERDSEIFAEMEGKAKLLDAEVERIDLEMA